MSGTSVFKRIFLTLLMAFGAFVAFYAMVVSYLTGNCSAGLIAQVVFVNLAVGSPVPLFWRTPAGLKVVGMLWSGALVLIGVSLFGG